MRYKFQAPSNNAFGDWGLTGTLPTTFTQATHPVTALNWRWDTDGSLKAQMIVGSTVVLASSNLAATLTPYLGKMLIWDFLVEDDAVTFLVIDPDTNALLVEEVLKVPIGDPRIALAPAFYKYARLVNSGAVTGTAAMGWVGDAVLYIKDGDIWSVNQNGTNKKTISGRNQYCKV